MTAETIRLDGVEKSFGAVRALAGVDLVVAPGECLEVDVVAVCEHTGAVPFRAAVWCGEGDAAEEIPLDGELRVVPGPIASAPGRGTVR